MAFRGAFFVNTDLVELVSMVASPWVKFFKAIRHVIAFFNILLFLSDFLSDVVIVRSAAELGHASLEIACGR